MKRRKHLWIIEAAVVSTQNIIISSSISTFSDCIDMFTAPSEGYS